jgi:hypothetical protein
VTLAATRQVSRHQSQIGSAAFVGREGELGSLRRALKRALRGEGSAILLEAPAGMGKTRLLRELAVEAGDAGVTVLTARGSLSDRRPYAALHEVTLRLRQASRWSGPESASLAPEPEATRRLARPLAAAEDPSHAMARRVRVQRELADQILGAGRGGAVVLLVDDLQDCDEASATVVATLAHRAPGQHLLLVVALRSGAAPRAAAPVATIRFNSTPLALTPLRRQDVGALVRSLFDGSPHCDHLACWINECAEGVPGRSVELSRHLVHQGVVRYVDGAWHVPADLGGARLPESVAEALRLRLRWLSPRARYLAEILCVHSGDLPLELCVSLAGVLSAQESDVCSALDELFDRDILVGSADMLRFRHDALRDELYRGLSEATRRLHHLHLGRSLARFERDPRRDTELESGWHLLRGGEELRGAEQLERAGMRLFRAQAFADAAPPLEAALRALERHGASRRRCCLLRELLVRCGVICDRELALRHGDVLLAELRGWAGLPIAERLGPALGRPLALIVAICVAGIRWLLSSAQRRGPSPLRALRAVIPMINHIAAIKALSLDVAGARVMPALLEPVSLISRRWIPYASYLLCCNFPLILTGQWQTVRVNCEKALALHHRLRRHCWDTRFGEGTLRLMLAMVTAAEPGPACLDHCLRLEVLGIDFFDVSAKLARLIRHRLRGEEREASALEAESHMLILQLGSMWMCESLLHWISALAYCGTRDTGKLKHSVAELERLVDANVLVGPVLQIVHACYLREAGRIEEASQVLARLLQRDDRQNPVIRQIALAELAETLLIGRDLEGARRVSGEGVCIGADPANRVLPILVRNACILAKAEARCGSSAAATERLDELRDVVGDNPFLLGLVHEASADVALAAGAAATAALHSREAARWFGLTGNPVLIQRSAQLGARIGSPARAKHVTTDTHPRSSTRVERRPAAPTQRLSVLVTRTLTRGRPAPDPDPAPLRATALLRRRTLRRRPSVARA